MNQNIYKYFRNTEKIANPFNLNKRFDEPTFLSFKLLFGDNESFYNYAGNKAFYDTMPHPLFYTGDVTEQQVVGVPTPGGILPITEFENVSYSAINYLINANEPTRAEMLKEFIGKFNVLQADYPYYFQSIDGIGELLKVDPTKGQRIPNDKKITITCLEAVDQRMSYLMNLYRKIVWDDVYQRWVLPDMMRYFTLKIFITEFRTFHSANNVNGSGQPDFSGTTLIPASNIRVPQPQIDMGLRLKNSQAPVATLAQKATPNNNYEQPIFMKILNDILPVWQLTCEMCEFDITDINYEHLGNLTVADQPIQGALRLGIKVGNIKELQMYPLFQHSYISDRMLNGLNRSKDTISTTSLNRMEYSDTLKVAQERTVDDIPGHVSGTPVIERTNQQTVDDTKGLIEQPKDFSEATNLVGKGEIDSPLKFYNDKTGAGQAVPFNPTLPNTWTGNLIDFGKAFAKNSVNKVIDKAKMTPVPGLGVSFEEVKAVLQSKNVIGALGLIRKGVDDVVKSQGIPPSSKLSEPILTDNIMRQFLIELTKSEATDTDSVILQSAANSALNDKGIWEKIKDYSLATDLIGKEEVNISKKIEGNTVMQNSGPRIKKIEISNVMENTPSSQATTNKLQ